MNTKMKNVGRAILISLPLLAGLAGNAQGAVGRIPGNFDVSPTGAATYQIPLWVSPGPNGMQPSLTLTYDSQRGSGIVGPGWALTGLSAITRCNRSVAQDGIAAAVDFTGWDKYCLDGKRLRVTSGTYGFSNSIYETEIADFTQVFLPYVNGTDPDYFYAKTKNGLTYEYGRTTDSRITVGSTPTAYMWLVNKVTDRAGNTYKVTYGPGAAGTVGTAVPLTIQYAPSTPGGSTYINTISFVYDAKETQYPSATDKGTRSYVAGNSTMNTNLLLEVRISSAGAPVRRYKLDYELAPVTLRPRLASVSECAKSSESDSVLTDCLAPTAIGYQNGSNGVSTSAITVASGNVGAIPLDMDGDGRSDVLFNDNGTLKVARGTASGTFAAPITVGPVQNGVVGVGDMTTKSFDDIIVRQGTTWIRYTWNGTSFDSATTGISLPANLSTQGLTDINGDGRPDGIAVSKAYNSSTRVYTLTVYTWLNWSPDKNTLTFAAPATHQRILACISTSTPCDAEILTGTEFTTGTARLDFNGDGKGDLVYLTLKPNLQAEISRGDLRFLSFNDSGTLTDIGGFASEFESNEFYDIVGFANLNDDNCTDLLMGSPFYGVSISPCRGTFGADGLGRPPIAAIDWNSDGRSDVLVGNGANFGVSISTASGMSSVIDTGIPISTYPANVFVIDFDGDGLQDFGRWGASGTVVYRHALPSTPPDLVTSITDGYGVNVSPTYGSILNGNYTKGTEAVYPERDLDSALYVVTSVTSTSGASSPNAPATYAQTYEYFEGRENLEGRGLEGFKRIRMTDGRNGFIRNNYRHTDFPKTGLVYQDDLSQSDGTLISRTETQHEVANRIPHVNNKSFFPYVDWSTTETFEVDPGGTLNGVSIKKTTVNPTVYDNYGNATTIEARVEDTFQVPPGTGSVWTSTITHTIAPDATNWCLNLPTRTVIQKTAPAVPTIVRTTDYAPDYIRCRIDSETIEPQTALQVTTGYQYDGFGNVNRITVTPTGLAARTTEVEWGPTGRYVESVTNALNQSMSNDWNRALGVRTNVTDPSSLETILEYDNFGRLTRENRPDDTATDFVLSACKGSNNFCGVPGSRSKVAVTLRSSSDGEVRTDSQYFDLFDRPIRSHQELLGNNVSEVTRTFDVYGRLSSESIPHDPAGDMHEVTYQYDLVGRTTLIRRPESAEFPNVNNDTRFTYTGPITTKKDALNRYTKIRRSAVGKIVEVTDATGSPSVLGKATAYTYDAFGNLLNVKDSKNNQIVLTYNVRGMKTGSVDPDMGTWTYEYYPTGELKKQTDAKNNIVEFEYDAVSRMTKRIESEGNTVWTWGSSQPDHNIGRLQRVEQRIPSGAVIYSEAYTYDVKGRLHQRQISSDSNYTYQYGYDPATGQLDSLTYPAVGGYQLALQYEYENGLLREVRDANNTYWHANAINPLGQVTEELLGNVVTTRRAIDLVTGLASRVESGIGQATNLQNESYLYDQVGNVTQRQKYTLTGEALSESFHYDLLNRLDYSTITSPAFNGAQNLDVDYDELGNITSRSDVNNGATWVYSTARPHAVTQAGSTMYEYDANGNVSKRNGFNIDWTSYNYPSVIRGPNKSMTFSYGPDRQRYRQVYTNGGATETTTYIGGALEKVNVNGVDDFRHYISANGQPIAIVSRKAGITTTRYLLRDHLGSIATIFDGTGAPILSESFAAFGGRRDAEDWDSDCNCSTLAQIASITRHGFTGHEMIGGHSMGLIHMNGRVMDSVTGRFLSPDPFVQFPFDSQSFNRYSYVRNNPLSTTDPSGFQEYDGDIREPEWDPGICWGACWWLPPRYYLPTYIPMDTTPRIPVSRATPRSNPGPAVLSAVGNSHCDFSPNCSDDIVWRGPAGGCTTYGCVPVPDRPMTPEEFWYSLGLLGDYVYQVALMIPGAQLGECVGRISSSRPCNNWEWGAGYLGIVPGAAPLVLSAREAAYLRSVAASVKASRGSDITATEIRVLNRAFGGKTELTGNADTVIANMSYREGAVDKAATAIRDIAGRHLFDNGNKRTAQAVAERILGSGANSAHIRSVIDRVGLGELKSVEEIAAALGH